MKPGTVFIGTIIVSLPESGAALVATASGTPNLDTLYIAYLPVSDGSTGVPAQTNLTDGSSVVCITDYTEEKKAYIIGPANFATGDVHDSLVGRSLYNVDDYAESENYTFKLLRDNLLARDITCLKYHAHGADMNTIPGDYDVTDVTGNGGLHVGRLVTQLRGSPTTFIDLSNVKDTIRVVSPNIETHTQLSFAQTSKELTVEDTAINDAEAFGFSAGQPFSIEDDEPVLKEDAIPLYRLQQIQGAAADGIELTVVAFPSDTDFHYCNTEPPVLAKRRTSLSGAVQDASALSIGTIKSPAIEAIAQVWYGKDRGDHDQTDILEPYPYASSTDKQDTTTDIDDTAINKVIDKLFSEDYIDKLCAKLAEHGLAVTTKDGTLASKINGTFKNGPTSAQQYELPDSIQLTDPVTGKAATYYASTSFITHEPDGSILICDGYGSEIRMTRGNIYISPALDLFIRPGRDCSAMVPRYLSLNAQNHVTINSSKSLYLRAVNDMKLAAAASEKGSGVLTIENGALSDSASNGIIIRSRAGMTVTGQNLFIGRTKWDSLTQNRVEDTSAGSIIIDAGTNGAVYHRCGGYVLDSISADLVAGETGFRMATNFIGMYTPYIEATANVIIGGKKTPEQVTLMYGNRILPGAQNPSLQVDGSLGVDEDIRCNGQGLFSTGLAARVIGTATGIDGIGVIQDRYRDPFAPIPFDKLDVIPGMGTQVSEMAKQLNQSIYQDYYLTSNGFAFPQYNVNITNVPGMMWQANDHDNGVGGFWKEEPVVTVTGTTTMCYPGLTVWSSAKVSLRNNEKNNLSDGYITNTEGETNA